MLRLLTDEHIDGRLIRGLRARLPDLDLVTAQEAGLTGAADPDLLAWAAQEDRILLTHDRNPMPGFAYDRVRAALPMPGVFVLDDRLAIGRALTELEIVIQCSEGPDWQDQVIFIPM